MEHTWEDHLLSLATVKTLESPSKPRQLNAQLLESAYHHCENLTAHHSRSFHLASQFLPHAKRQAMRALYAFCRVTDDLIDRPCEDTLQQFAQWRQVALSKTPPEDVLPAVAWADTRSRFRIPLKYAEQLIDGVARDCYQTRYQTFNDLTTYAYSVASTVGLMSMYIIGFSSEAAVPYAIKLGVALQLTNILRDVEEDWQAGRCYLPIEELADYGITEDEIAAGRVTARWRKFMQFQIARNRQLYAEAEPGIALLHRDGRMAVLCASTFYRGILKAIEAQDYDVFHQRAHVSTQRKLIQLPALWWQSQRMCG